MISTTDLRNNGIQEYFNRLYDIGFPCVSVNSAGAMIWVVASAGKVRKDSESIRGEGPSLLAALAQAYAIARKKEAA